MKTTNNLFFSKKEREKPDSEVCIGPNEDLKTHIWGKRIKKKKGQIKNAYEDFHDHR